VCAAAVLVLGTSCAHASGNGPVVVRSDLKAGQPHVTPIAGRAVQDGDGRNPSGEQIDSMLRQSGLEYDTLEPGHRWKLSFAGKQHPMVDVYVLYSNNFTVILGKLCTLEASSGKEVYQAIARRNFDLEQLKLSVNKNGEVFASFEVPTRILDRRELLENIVSLAAALDSMNLEDTGPTPQPLAQPPAAPRGQELPVPTPHQSDPPVIPIRWETPATAPDQVL
jgi:hypothetical protein